MSLLGSTFFGLTSEYRLHLFTQIHEIVYHGNGGYDWETVYNMPIWLRKFTFKKIQEYFDKQQEEIDKRKKLREQPLNSKNTINRPNIKPDYVSKAPKK